MTSDVIIPLAISAIFKLGGAVAIGVCGAALLTWKRSYDNRRDIDAAFIKIRNLEGKVNGRERSELEKTMAE